MSDADGDHHHPAAHPARYGADTALVVVDVQNDFADPAGSLYVKGGEEVVSLINDEIGSATAAGARIVFTRDWHPPSTPHFAKDGGIWPVHCVAGTWGAEFHPDLDVSGIGVPGTEPDPAEGAGVREIRKGAGDEDGYSGFTTRHPVTGEETPTGLRSMLDAAGVERLVVVGLATDYCVKATAVDGAAAGFATTVLAAAIRPVDLSPGDGARALDAMADSGVTIA